MNKSLLFDILFKTIFTILNIVLLGLLLITPADAIRQALNNNQLYNVFVIAGTYFLTVLLAIIIYASRLWTSNTVLKAIPKTYIPVEKGDVSEKVRRMIVGSLNRSAAIAWEFRPHAAEQLAADEAEAREPVVNASEPQGKKRWFGIFRKKLSNKEKDEQAVALPPFRPSWDGIAHDGWSSPLLPDLPNVQYTSVIQELPHLVEARAVSVAPPDPDSTSNPPIPDLRVVDLLTRPLSIGVRDYIEHLISLEIVTSPSAASEFLDAYEYARFSAQPLSEPQFRDLMRLFAELLRSMQALSPTLLESFDHHSDASDIDDDRNSIASTTTSNSMHSFHSASTHSGSVGTIRTARSRPAGTSRASTTNRPSAYSAAPATARSRRRQKMARSTSANSFAQSRRMYEGSSPSSESVGSSSQGSVIRLNPSREEGELPYTLTIPPVR